MSLTRTIENLFRRLLPSPFVIALLLTAVTMLMAWFYGDFGPGAHSGTRILKAWERGLWNRDLLVFAYQMMLILVLGHVLVLSPPMERLMRGITGLVRNGAQAALLVAASTMLVSFFNWGLGLIFGAILARKIGEHAQREQMDLNYPLIGACGYLGLMVWHGGISGSAPIKAAEEGHIRSLLAGTWSEEALAALPGQLPTSETIFSVWNLGLFCMVLGTLSLVAYFLGRRRSASVLVLPETEDPLPDPPATGAERLDRSRMLAGIFALLIFTAFLLQYLPELRRLNITPDMLNVFMLGLAILLHGSVAGFLAAVQSAIGDTSGILIQFPLYFGIMGIMNESGMITMISDFFVTVGSERSFPVFTFFSAGLVNIFVPSGGGQWAVQGPVILEAATKLQVPLPKALMALAYGDQLTNMLQPFWALPLLAITKLKARELLPYTLIFMIIGGLIYLGGLLFW